MRSLQAETAREPEIEMHYIRFSAPKEIWDLSYNLRHVARSKLVCMTSLELKNCLRQAPEAWKAGSQKIEPLWLRSAEAIRWELKV